VKRSNRLVIFIGVLLAILAFVGIVIVLNQNPHTPSGGAEPTPTTVAVLVAKQNIAIGDSVTPALVEVKQVDPAAVEGTRLADPSQVGGRTALVDVPAGSQVNQQTFGGVGNVCISCMLQAGEKAIPIQVDLLTGVDYLIQPGDHVDVLVAVQLPAIMNPDGKSQRTVKVVLQDKRVLYVSGRNAATLPQATPVPGASPGAAASAPAIPTSVIVVIAGDDQDAEVLRYAQRDQTELQGTGNSAVVALTIRNTKDDKTEVTTGITINELIKTYGLLVPQEVPLTTPKPSP
jgi:Flp pilus assembly protein CpaB